MAMSSSSSCQRLIDVLYSYVDECEKLKKKQDEERQIAIYQSMVYGNNQCILSHQRIKKNEENTLCLKEFVKSKSTSIDHNDLLNRFWTFIAEQHFDSEAIVNDLKHKKESNIIRKIRNFESRYLRGHNSKELTKGKSIKDFKNEWKKGRQIGWGSQGNVFEVTQRGNRYCSTSEYVAKIMFFTESNEEKMNEAINEYHFVKSSNLLNYAQIYVDDLHKSKAIIIMQKLSYTLSSKRNLREDEIKKVAADLAANIKLIHDLNYVHLDIKTENIMWNKQESKWKIIDYDLAKYIDPRYGYMEYRKFIGTKRWTAPEIVLSEDINEMFLITKKCDIYSFGLVLLNLVCGGNHYEKIMEHANIRNLSEMGVLSLFASKKGNDLIQQYLMSLKNKKFAIFLSKILRFEASERPNIGEVIRMDYLKN